MSGVASRSRRLGNGPVYCDRPCIISKASDPEHVKNRTLFFGDNLKILREKFPSDEGYFDLIYLDPPFNSRRDYNVLYKEGLVDSPAQVSAFEDTWHWTPDTQEQFDDLVSDAKYPQRVSNLMLGLEQLIGHNDMMAYLTMMTVRLIELRRVLKSTGSIYLHCDPTASHYLKIVMDAIFGARNFRNEIVWKRSHAHSDAKQGAKHYGRVTDSILFYSKSDDVTWNTQFVPYDEEYVERDYRRLDPDGRRYRIDNLQGPGGAAKGNPFYEVMGVSRHWRYSREKMDELIRQGRVIQTRPGAVPQYKRYLDEMPGVPLQNLWADLPVLSNRSKESLGYPTQKPEALLERVLKTSTNPGDWVLDPFGGCGTTAAAAEHLDRNWVVIDVTTLAINLVKRRLEEAYPDKDLAMTVDGYPADVAGARELFARDPFEFEYWSCDLVDARPAGGKGPERMKGADRGIDGVITLVEPVSGGKTKFHRVLVQVKGGHVSAAQLRDFRGTIQREKALGGVFITLEPPSKPMVQEAVEVGMFSYELTGRKYPMIQIFTVEQLLSGERPDLPNVIAYAKQAAPATAVPEQGRLL
jgi:DNA modification methylase